MEAPTKYSHQTMKYPITIHNKDTIAHFCWQSIYRHLYMIGDLDDFFWHYTQWHGLELNRELVALGLLYSGLPLPVLLMHGENLEAMQRLLANITHLLPARFYAHLDVGLEASLHTAYELTPHGLHYQMALTQPALLDAIPQGYTVVLTEDDLPAIQQLYRLNYPDNWFNARMLKTGQYMGIKEGEQWVSVAGVHVYSEEYEVAALGNITTHVDHRSQGLGKIVTADLCRQLLQTVKHIGLNVKADNKPAIHLYGQLGFTIAGEYGEYMVNRRPT